jgi:transposase-like protein
MATQHPAEIRAEVMAALLTGQAVSRVAEDYHLPISTVSRWRKQARREAGQSEEIGGLLMDYLRQALTTLQKQAKAFGDPEWLRGQGSADLAVLHGVMTDKAIRLLEALSGGPVENRTPHG